MTCTVSVTEWVIDPLVAVTVTVYVPSGILCPALTVRVDVPDPPDANTIEVVLSED